MLLGMGLFCYLSIKFRYERITRSSWLIIFLSVVECELRAQFAIMKSKNYVYVVSPHPTLSLWEGFFSTRWLLSS